MVDVDDFDTPKDNEVEKKMPLILDADNLSVLSVSSCDSIDNLKLETMGQYTCDECSSIPKIINLDDKTKTISFKCEKHGLKTMNLNTYLSNCLNYNPQNWKCSACANIQRDCKGKEEEFIYCQCNNVFCPGCFSTHQKKEKGEHKFIIQSNKFNLRCKKSKDHYGEVYKGYCYECKTHYCQKCENEHKWHEKVDIKTMQIQEKEVDKIKEINKEYERLISYYKGMIQLNKLIMYSYKNCRDNYYNLNNINTIIKNDKRNEILNTLNDKENGAIIPGEEDSNITNYMNELYQQNIDSEINKISISNKFFNNYDLRVLVQMPLKYLRFLDLENNSISQIDCLKKSDFANLVILNLNNNAIKDILPLENASFKDNLQALFLRNNCIKDISVFKKKCASLRQLDLRNNCIDDISVFDSMKDYLANLQSLYLANNAFDKNQFENAIKNINELTEKDIE
jgi:hypothetical protein